MTSSSGSAERLAALVLLTALAACADERVVETQAIVFADTELCERAVLMGLTTNGYRATLYEYVPPDDPAAPQGCAACLLDGRCIPLAESCVCDQPRAPVTLNLNGALAPLRFEDLDADVSYCVLLRGYAQPGIGVPRPEVCGCEALDGAATRLCGVSAFPGTVAENSTAFIIPMECRACPMLDP
jgi:hypothetical protein